MHIMVLNDGTTYSDVTGCKMVWVVDDATPDQIEQWIKDIDGNSAKGWTELITEFK